MKISNGQIFFEPNELAELDPVSITALAVYGKPQNQSVEDVAAILLNDQIAIKAKSYLASIQTKELIETFAVLTDEDKAVVLQAAKDAAVKSKGGDVQPIEVKP